MKPDWSHLAKPAVVRPLPTAIQEAIDRTRELAERHRAQTLNGKAQQLAQMFSAGVGPTPSQANAVIGLKTPSVGNLREHWSKRHKRNQSQARAIGVEISRWVETAKPLVAITLTRVAPRQLDSDNLATALKACRDSIAKKLRIDDGSPLVEWRYQQRKGPAAVEFSIEVAP